VSGDQDWTIPEPARPDPAHTAFDLGRVLDAIVQVRSEIPADAFTAPLLGTERQGSGVVLNQRGLVLTIGYLVTEAATVWLTTNRGRAVPADCLIYDFASGFGLLQALGRLELEPVTIGSAARLETGDALIAAAGGGRAAAMKAALAGKREFAGYWEYHLEEALFTLPAHPHWGGAALLDQAGELVGVGSLLIQGELDERRSAAGNMFVPVDLAVPLVEDVLRHGRPRAAPRPWLGLYACDSAEGVTVTGLAPRGPAAQAGIREGDRVLAVAGREIGELGRLWRAVWALGGPGVAVPLRLERAGRAFERTLIAADRASFMKAPRLH
jgi:S1-C subfamily serine protease